MAHAQWHPDIRMPRLHVSEEHQDIQMIHLWNRFRTAPDSVEYCSGKRTLQSFSCRRKAYPELRHPDIRIYPDTCKRSLRERERKGGGGFWWVTIFLSMPRELIRVNCPCIDSIFSVKRTSPVGTVWYTILYWHVGWEQQDSEKKSMEVCWEWGPPSKLKRHVFVAGDLWRGKPPLPCMLDGGFSSLDLLRSALHGSYMMKN